jgi:hypothetical protein
VGDRPAVEGSGTGGPGGSSGVVGHGRVRIGRNGARRGHNGLLQRLHGRPHRFQFLAQRRDAHVGVVRALADHAHVVAQVVDEQLFIRESLAHGVERGVDPAVERLQGLVQRLVERGQRDRELLRLLLEHADVGRHLQMLAILRRGELRRQQLREEHECDGSPH